MTDPIIVFDPGWDTPEWLFGEIKLQRLAHLITGEETATDAEALAYVSNASLCVPLASEWLEIYEYLLTKAMRDKVLRELKKEELTDYKMSLLRELKGWIWRQKQKVRNERARGERTIAEAQAAAKAPQQLKLEM